MKYKTVKKSVRWCYECNTEIIGNGNKLNPYQCECGKWKYDRTENDYFLIKDNKQFYD